MEKENLANSSQDTCMPVNAVFNFTFQCFPNSKKLLFCMFAHGLDCSNFQLNNGKSPEENCLSSVWGSTRGAEH